jgi:hypothetical protein
MGQKWIFLNEACYSKEPKPSSTNIPFIYNISTSAPVYPSNVKQDLWKHFIFTKPQLHFYMHHLVEESGQYQFGREGQREELLHWPHQLGIQQFSQAKLRKNTDYSLVRRSSGRTSAAV